MSRPAGEKEFMRALIVSLVLIVSVNSFAAKKCSEAHVEPPQKLNVIQWLKEMANSLRNRPAAIPDGPAADSSVSARAPVEPPKRIQYQKSGQTHEVTLVTEAAFDQLAPGTILVDARTFAPVVVGVDFFDLKAKDSDGHLLYGFSTIIRDQFLLSDPRVMRRSSNYEYGSSTYSARRANSGIMNQFDFPDAMRDFLVLEASGWRQYGNELTFRSMAGIESTTVYFEYPRDYGRLDGSYHVRSVSVFLGWGLGHTPNRLQYFQGIAKALNLGAPTADSPFMALRSPEEMEKFFQILIDAEGGRQALIDRYNQHDRNGRSDLGNLIKQLRELNTP